jgi:hypothetical protein
MCFMLIIPFSISIKLSMFVSNHLFIVQFDLYILSVVCEYKDLNLDSWIM